MVGHTDYQYPPRKYEIPEGLLREGENTIVIRVKCENGHGRFTDGKKYALWNDEEEIDLTGKWYYEIGAACEQIEPTDFVNWKPTGLYNGMTAMQMRPDRDGPWCGSCKEGRKSFPGWEWR